MKTEYRLTKYACYLTNVSMSVVAALPPLLFLTFREVYNISFSLLGLLVFLNYGTQLAVDLIFSFYSHRFNLKKTVRFTPLLTAIGMLLYAVLPLLFPSYAYVGLVLGTLVFSASSGLVEVLISPVIAAIPSPHPDRDMSKLHSIYAWGVVGVVIVSTLFLKLFGTQHWSWLTALWLLVPLSAAVLFFLSDIPHLKTPEKAEGVLTFLKNPKMLLSMACIFVGGASECTMAQWSSGYLEYALHIPKVWGDIIGVALFGLFLGLGRTLYSSFGKNIERLLVLCAFGTVACYLTAALCNVPLIGLLACMLTGFTTSVMWPGNLIVSTNRFPSAGVAMFALMAAAGDFGAALGTQMMGSISDFATTFEPCIRMAERMGMEIDRFGMKVGLVCVTVFPLLAIFLYIAQYRSIQKDRKNK